MNRHLTPQLFCNLFQEPIICHGQEEICIDLFLPFFNHICETHLAEEVNLCLKMLLSLVIQLPTFGSQEKAAEECEFVLNCIIFKTVSFLGQGSKICTEKGIELENSGQLVNLFRLVFLDYSLQYAGDLLLASDNPRRFVAAGKGQDVCHIQVFKKTQKRWTSHSCHGCSVAEVLEFQGLQHFPSLKQKHQSKATFRNF